jgi:hypothetical protein
MRQKIWVVDNCKITMENFSLTQTKIGGLFVEVDPGGHLEIPVSLINGIGQLLLSNFL